MLIQLLDNELPLQMGEVTIIFYINRFFIFFSNKLIEEWGMRNGRVQAHTTNMGANRSWKQVNGWEREKSNIINELRRFVKTTIETRIFYSSKFNLKNNLEFSRLCCYFDLTLSLNHKLITLWIFAFINYHYYCYYFYLASR